MIRVVFDTNILYSAILHAASMPARALDLIVTGQVLPCVSDAVLEEYQDVLLRPELDLHAKRRRVLLETFSRLALHVTTTGNVSISPHDDDNRIYECAEAAWVNYIITGNAKHFRPYKQIQIATARQIVELLGNQGRK